MEKKYPLNEGYQPAPNPSKNDSTNPDAGYIPVKDKGQDGGNPPKKP